MQCRSALAWPWLAQLLIVDTELLDREKIMFETSSTASCSLTFTGAARGGLGGPVPPF